MGLADGMYVDICLYSRGISVIKFMGYLSPKSWDMCQQTCFLVHVIQTGLGSKHKKLLLYQNSDCVRLNFCECKIRLMFGHVASNIEDVRSKLSFFVCL